PYINIEAFEKGVLSQFTDGEGATISNATDVLIVWDGARCGLVGKGITGAVGSTLARLFSSGVDYLYLYYFLQSMFTFINSKPRGVGIPHVDPGIFWNIDFPLAPLPEQHRIVAKIEELLTQLDAAESALKRTKANLERYRRSVLQAAVTGELTKEWRTQHQGVSDESKSGLPAGWVWSTIEQLAEHRLGKMLDKAKNRGDFYPYLRNSNVRWFRFDLTDLKQIQVMENELENVSVRSGDIVVCEGGEPGRCAVWESARPIIIQKALHRIRVKKGVLPHYITYVLAEGSFTGKLEEFFTGSTIKHFTGASLRKYPFPVPTLEEQQIIIDEIEKSLTIIAALESSTTKLFQHIALLRQSILDKAFNGQLVDQNTDDEPASKLLDRIEQERIFWHNNQKEHKPSGKVSKSIGKGQLALPLPSKKELHLFESLKKSGVISPSKLLDLVNCRPEDIPVFFEELRNEIFVLGRIIELRPDRTKEGNLEANNEVG
ncbi:hypothetical protein EG832_05575, partial [bacterium]|nr:hypothetical protein [bacterium]